MISKDKTFFTDKLKLQDFVFTGQAKAHLPETMNFVGQKNILLNALDWCDIQTGLQQLITLCCGHAVRAMLV